VREDALNAIDNCSTHQNTGLSDGVVECMLNIVRQMQFDPPPGSEGSRLTIPLSFVPPTRK
jgi:hypothetical protein